VTRRLVGKCVIVTGASSGIGAEAARRFAAEGATVALTSERENELNEVVRSIIDAGGQAKAFVVDFSRPSEVNGLFGRIEDTIGPVDVLVNNAGIGLGAPILNSKPADVRILFEINFFALVELCKEALAAMSQRRAGRIINVSSAAGRFGSPNVSAYSASKGAVHAFTQALRIEAIAGSVLVSEVLPISVKTKFFDRVKGDRYKPSGIVLTVEQVARSIVDCAASSRPIAEVLPYYGIRAVFIANAMFPGLLSRIAQKRYLADLEAGRSGAGKAGPPSEPA